MLMNGRIYSPGAVDAQAMLVADGLIAWIGDDLSAQTMSADIRIDLGGAFVVPGFVDGHIHTTATGQALTGLDLGATATLAEALAAVERHARAAGGRPLIASGWDETRWPERRPPTAAELDRASYGGSVYLVRTDAHSAVASSSLMAAVPGLPGLDGFSPTGVLTKDAHHAVRSVALSVVTAAQRRELQRTALRHAAGQGIVAVHEMAGPAISSAEDLQELLALAVSEPLPAVYGFWGELHGIATAHELGAVAAGGDLFCDGSLGSHTAALLEPYDDDPAGTGYLRYDTADLVAHILACTEAGLLTGFHAIGDAATSQVVQAMIEAERAVGGARVSGAGHRIEHAELIADIDALARCGLTASVQPAFDATWGGPDGMYAQRLGTGRADRLNPLAQLAAAGAPLVLGSDSPVTSLDPWGTVRAAVYPSNPAHALSPRAAFTAHTRGGWRAVRAEDSGAGVLRPGAPATYAIFEAGGLGVEAPDDRVTRWSTDERANVPGLPDLAPGVELPRCLQTVLNGTVIFDSGELS
jgi:predicted amidohydrolase YtcJ